MSFTDVLNVYTRLLYIMDSYILVGGIGIVTIISCVIFITFFIDKLMHSNGPNGKITDDYKRPSSNNR